MATIAAPRSEPADYGKARIWVAGDFLGASTIRWKLQANDRPAHSLEMDMATSRYVRAPRLTKVGTGTGIRTQLTGFGDQQKGNRSRMKPKNK